MPNDVTITVKGNNAAKPALDTAKKDMTDFGAETGKVSKRIDELTAEILELNKQLDATGDTKLFTLIAEKEAELGKFQRAAKRLAAELAEQAGQAGSQAAQEFSGLFTDTLALQLRNAGPYAIGALVGVGALFAPILGAMVGGAVLGGVGLGGLIGGVAAASQDPRVKTAGRAFAESAMGSLGQLGEHFVEPTITFLDRFALKIGAVAEGPLAGAMESLSRELVPFGAGLEGFIDGLIPGFVSGLKAAEPVLRVLAQELPGLGADISAMFAVIAEDPDGAIIGMKLLIDMIGEVLRLFGAFVRFSSEVVEGLNAIGVEGTDALYKVFDALSFIMPPLSIVAGLFGELAQELQGQRDALDSSRQPAADYAKGIEGLGMSAEEAAEQLNAMAKAIDEVFDRQMSVDQATLRWHRGLIDLRKELAEGQKTLSLFSEEGLRNRDAMLDSIQEAQRIRQATIDQNPDDLAGANAAFEAHIAQLERMGRAAGFTQDELNDLLGEYKTGHTIGLAVEFPGLVQALEDLRELQDLQAGLGKIGGRASRNNGGIGSFLMPSLGGIPIPGFAHGGISGGLTMVGEHGRELVDLPYGSTVIPNPTTEAMMSGGSGGSRQPIIVQLIDPQTGAVTRQALIDDALTRGVASSDVEGAYP